MPASVNANYSVAPLNEKQHLSVPVVGTQWPAMMEDDGLPATPVFIEYLDTVLSCDRAHAQVSFSILADAGNKIELAPTPVRVLLSSRPSGCKPPDRWLEERRRSCCFDKCQTALLRLIFGRLRMRSS
jgi:hypothetical protein